MRTLLFCLTLSLAGAANADSLAEANKLAEAKSYPQALHMLSKLADGGNPDAQLRLGEMYWYGEGMAPDRAKGDALFAKAAAGGSKAAAAATELSRKREQHKDDIAHWTARYDGADLHSGGFDCAAPVFPAVSTTKLEIKATADKADAWAKCYDAFIDNVAAQPPAGKRIPEEVLAVMSDQEVEQARIHLDKVYISVLAAAKLQADATLAQRDAWFKATTEHLAEMSRKGEAATNQAQVVLQRLGRSTGWMMGVNR